MIIGPIMQQRGSAQTLKGNKIIELLSSVPGNCFNVHDSEQTNRFFERRMLLFTIQTTQKSYLLISNLKKSSLENIKNYISTIGTIKGIVKKGKFFGRSLLSRRKKYTYIE